MGIADFDALHNRLADEKAVALAFDLLLSVACDKKCAGNTKTYRDKINQQSNRCRRGPSGA